GVQSSEARARGSHTFAECRPAFTGTGCPKRARGSCMSRSSSRWCASRVTAAEPSRKLSFLAFHVLHFLFRIERVLYALLLSFRKDTVPCYISRVISAGR